MQRTIEIQQHQTLENLTSTLRKENTAWSTYSHCKPPCTEPITSSKKENAANFLPIHLFQPGKQTVFIKGVTPPPTPPPKFLADFGIAILCI
jgi:hypothetical protein